jgi:hypothetical protein
VALSRASIERSTPAAVEKRSGFSCAEDSPELHALADAKLMESGIDVRSNRRETDAQAKRDLLVGKALRGQVDDLIFPRA